MPKHKKNTPSKQAIRPLYEEHGADGYYRQFGAQYRNPHETIIRHSLNHVWSEWGIAPQRVLDLACGSGEVTLALSGFALSELIGVDPYTGNAYEARTGHRCLPYSFEQIEQGVLSSESFDLIVCSFALHLAEVSRLPLLCYQLAQISPLLIVLTPHKRPQLRKEWGWQLQQEYLYERVRTRLYHRVLLTEKWTS